MLLITSDVSKRALSPKLVIGVKGLGSRLVSFRYLVSRLFTRELSSGRFFINLEKRSFRLVEVVDFRTNFEDILKI